MPSRLRPRSSSARSSADRHRPLAVSGHLARSSPYTNRSRAHRGPALSRGERRRSPDRDAKVSPVVPPRGGLGAAPWPLPMRSSQGPCNVPAQAAAPRRLASPSLSADAIGVRRAVAQESASAKARSRCSRWRAADETTTLGAPGGRRARAAHPRADHVRGGRAGNDAVRPAGHQPVPGRPGRGERLADVQQRARHRAADRDPRAGQHGQRRSCLRGRHLHQPGYLGDQPNADRRADWSLPDGELEQRREHDPGQPARRGPDPERARRQPE